MNQRAHPFMVEDAPATAWQTIRLALATGVALAVLLFIPATAGMVTFLVVQQIDHRCPAPAAVILRGSLAPERDFAKLEMPEDAGR